MQLPAPFGKYELLKRIATGGMAEVFLARSFGVAGFEKRLVIKRIREEYADDPRFIQMFINEAKIGVHLNHPNVVQVYDLGKVGQSWYMAMEHLHGRDLTRLVKTLRARDEKLPLGVSVAIVARACRGLHYAHTRTDAQGAHLGLVHRDVSPHNLMVTFDGEVKVVDFGVARLMNTRQGEEQETSSRPGGGKYAYMSPEQAAGGSLDHRTDVFSAGIVLWELVVGHRLFRHPDPAEKLRLVREAVIPHPASEGAPIDDDLWDILQRALAHHPDDRYINAAMFEEDLRAWLFRHRMHAGRAEIQARMSRAFPKVDNPDQQALDLKRVLADLERLDDDPSEATPTPTSETHTPGTFPQSDGEQRNVTVLVVDVDGFTDLSARLGPPSLFGRQLSWLRWLRGVADGFDGLVHRVVDDQVLLLFGARRARADDLDRALSCALELQRRIGDLRSKGLSLGLAIGVHAGDVTVTRVGRKVRYVARGDTTRRARRLSSIADHDQVLVSEPILRRAEQRFRLRRGPDLPNRGGKAPSPTFLLDGPRKGVHGPSRGPWLRRGDELEVVRGALAGLGEGHGATISLVGGPGSGKSRLVREIRDRAVARGLPFYLARCTPFGEDPPMEPFRDLVREVLGLEPDSERERVIDAVKRLAQLGLSEVDCSAISGLLSVGAPAGRDATWQALSRMMVGLSREGPVIIGLEDLHLARAREYHRLVTLVRAARDLPVLFFFTYRGELPEQLAMLGSRVDLGAFPAPAQARLVRSLLDAREIDPEVLALVERTCEGNPLYIEEMVTWLVRERRLVVTNGAARLAEVRGGLEVPEGLAGLLTARIDDLDPASKGALQIAAIIGLTFSVGLLRQSAGVDDPIPLVSDLAGAGLIVRGDVGHDTYTFASELVREATLRSILGVQRRDYHRMVAAGIEAQYPNDPQWSEAVAHHCAEGGRLLDAARFAHRAGEFLVNEQYLERARMMLRYGLEWLAKVPSTPETWEARVQGEAMLHQKLGAVNLLLGDTAGGERSLQLCLDIATDAGLPWIEVHAHVALGKSYLQRGKLRLASAHLEQARGLLEVEHEPTLAQEALEATAVLAYEQGRNADAERLWQQALDAAAGDPAAEARSLLGLANRYLRTGDNDAAEPLLNSALESAQRAGDRILEGRVLNNIGLLAFTNGATLEAIERFRQALQVREGIGYTVGVVVNHHNIGDAWFSSGDWARAHVSFERSRELAGEIGWERGVLLNDVYLAYIEAHRSSACRPRPTAPAPWATWSSSPLACGLPAGS